MKKWLYSVIGFLAFFGALAIGNFALTIGGADPVVTVKGDDDKITVIIPRSPTDVTAAVIACEGKVTTLRREASVTGYRAERTFTWIDENKKAHDAYYSLVLTVDPVTATPLDQYSVYWEFDGVKQADGPSFVSVDNQSLNCILKRADKS